MHNVEMIENILRDLKKEDASISLIEIVVNYIPFLLDTTLKAGYQQRCLQLIKSL
jgi:hypothetical protein